MISSVEGSDNNIRYPPLHSTWRLWSLCSRVEGGGSGFGNIANVSFNIGQRNLGASHRKNNPWQTPVSSFSKRCVQADELRTGCIHKHTTSTKPAVIYSSKPVYHFHLSYLDPLYCPTPTRGTHSEQNLRLPSCPTVIRTDLVRQKLTNSTNENISLLLVSVLALLSARHEVTLYFRNPSYF